MAPIIDVDDLAGETMSTDDEQMEAYKQVCSLIDKFLNDRGHMPHRLYVNENEELQSFLMYSAQMLGLSFELIKKDTHVS